MKGYVWKKEKPARGAVFPNSREGHTLTYISNLNQLILFGGVSSTRMNDIYLYDFCKSQYISHPYLILDGNYWKHQVTTGR